ncbi:MAG: hypothetical protein DRJ28_10840 [Actinobacteria bacterium]|nr:MAG: hypothetical protein DRJ28_10840 [Actinomycetota bacterium]
MFAKLTFGVTFMLVLAACSNSTVSEAVNTSTTQVATTSATQVATTTTTLDPDVQVLDPVGRLMGNGQRLSVGDYTTTVMTPTVTFSTTKFWDFVGEFPSLLLLGQPERQQGLNFILFPTYSGETVVETIQNEAIFDASQVVPATVGGIDGVSFIVDIVVPGGGSAETTVFPNNQTYSQVDLDPPRFTDGEQIRFTVVEVGDNVVVIMAAAGPFGFRDFLETADELLATVTFG